MKKKYQEMIDQVKSQLTVNDYDNIRTRWDKEDKLLSSRSNAFLTANALLFTASQIQSQTLFNMGISILGIVVTIFWVLISKKTATIINYLYDITFNIRPVYLSTIYNYYQSRLSPTGIIAKVLPYTILVSWIIYIGLLISNIIPK